MPILNTSAANVALGQLTNLPFANLIGGPLNAAIEAQARAAHTTVEFIQSVGFNEIDGELVPLYVEFLFEDSGGASRRVKVPLLLILPIPFIVIDTVDIQFKARISASASQQSESRTEVAKAGAASARFRFWGQQLNMSASYSAKKDSKASQESKYSIEYTMDVQVHASQAGVPQGMAAVLNILQEGVSNTPSQTQVKIFSLPSLLETGDGTAFLASGTDFKVLVLNNAGEPVSAAKVEVKATAGAVSPPATVPTTNTEGIATITIKPDPAVVAAAGDFEETLQVTVIVNEGTVNEERTVLSRPVKVRRLP